MKKTIKIVLVTVLLTHTFWAVVIWSFVHFSGSTAGPFAATEQITNRYALMLVKDVRDVSDRNYTFSVSEWGANATNFVATNHLSIVGPLSDGQGFTIAVHDAKKP